MDGGNYKSLVRRGGKRSKDWGNYNSKGDFVDGKQRTPRDEFLKLHGFSNDANKNYNRKFQLNRNPSNQNSFNNRNYYGKRKSFDRGIDSGNQYETNFKLSGMRREAGNNRSRAFYDSFRKQNSQYKFYVGDRSPKRYRLSASLPTINGASGDSLRRSKKFPNNCHKSKNNHSNSSHKSLFSTMTKCDKRRREKMHRRNKINDTKIFVASNNGCLEESADEKENKEMSCSTSTASNDSVVQSEPFSKRESTPNLEEVSEWEKDRDSVDFKKEAGCLMTEEEEEDETEKETEENITGNFLKESIESINESTDIFAPIPANLLSPISDASMEDMLGLGTNLEKIPLVKVRDLKYLLGRDFDPNEQTYFDLTFYPQLKKGGRKRIPKRGCGIRTSVDKPMLNTNQKDIASKTTTPTNNECCDLKYLADMTTSKSSPQKNGENDRNISTLNSSSSTSSTTDLNEAVQQVHNQKLKTNMDSIEARCPELTDNNVEHDNGYDSVESEVFSYPLTSRTTSTFSDWPRKISHTEQMSTRSVFSPKNTSATKGSPKAVISPVSEQIPTTLTWAPRTSSTVTRTEISENNFSKTVVSFNEFAIPRSPDKFVEVNYMKSPPKRPTTNGAYGAYKWSMNRNNVTNTTESLAIIKSPYQSDRVEPTVPNQLLATPSPTSVSNDWMQTFAQDARSITTTIKIIIKKRPHLKFVLTDVAKEILSEMAGK